MGEGKRKKKRPMSSLGFAELVYGKPSKPKRNGKPRRTKDAASLSAEKASISSSVPVLQGIGGSAGLAAKPNDNAQPSVVSAKGFKSGKRPVMLGRPLGHAMSAGDLHNVPREQQQQQQQHGLGLHKENSVVGDTRSNITVCVRVRPMLAKEKNMSLSGVVDVLDNVVIITDPSHDEDDVLRARRVHEKRYAFDHVFPDTVSNEEVFQMTTAGLIAPLMEGFNATVFAYGATGAGKTHTMLGDSDRPGVMVLTLQQLFREIAKHSDQFLYDVSLSYLEIYNENIRDLLVDNSDYLDLREDPIRGPMVAGISEVKAGNVDDVMTLLTEGNLRRTQEPTKANETSSRSHAILQVTVAQRERTAGVSHFVKIGKLSLVDLAGSERASQTENRGMRMIEGANINRSLLALANCINALSDKNKRGSYVNFRDSKLTRLLKDSLGGSCKTVMIAAVSPVHTQYEESHNTLKYANRAKDIKTTIRRNVKSVEYHIAQYNQIIADLRAEILDLKGRLGSIVTTRGGSANATLNKRAPSVDPYDLADRAEATRLRAQLSAYADSHMQLRRALSEVTEQNTQNAVEMQRLGLEIRILEDEYRQDHDPMILSQIMEAREALKVIHRNTMSNDEIRAELGGKVAKSELVGREFEKLIPGEVVNEDRKEILELEYRQRVMEMETLEVESQLAYERSQSALKDLEIQELQRLLAQKDRTIARLRTRLTDANIPFSEEDAKDPGMTKTASRRQSAKTVIISNTGEADEPVAAAMLDDDDDDDEYEDEDEDDDDDGEEDDDDDGDDDGEDDDGEDDEEEIAIETAPSLHHQHQQQAVFHPAAAAAADNYDANDIEDIPLVRSTSQTQLAPITGYTGGIGGGGGAGYNYGAPMRPPSQGLPPVGGGRESQSRERGSTSRRGSKEHVIGIVGTGGETTTNTGRIVQAARAEVHGYSGGPPANGYVYNNQPHSIPSGSGNGPSGNEPISSGDFLQGRQLLPPTNGSKKHNFANGGSGAVNTSTSSDYSPGPHGSNFGNNNNNGNVSQFSIAGEGIISPRDSNNNNNNISNISNISNNNNNNDRKKIVAGKHQRKSSDGALNNQNNNNNNIGANPSHGGGGGNQAPFVPQLQIKNLRIERKR